MKTVRHLVLPVIVTLGLLCVLLGLVVPARVAHASTYAWTLTGSMTTTRQQHTATLLPNGQVLVAGGQNGNGPTTPTSAELYDPSTGTWTATGSMTTGHYGHTATLLSNGQVLVAGGFDLSGTPQATAELYDPSTGTWTATGSMNVARENFTATLLQSGQVLVAGGLDSSFSVEATAELYDPSTGTWTATGSMHMAREIHTATLLPNGQVLVAGGFSSGSPQSSAELYDPSTGNWTVTGSMSIARENFTATLLQSGQVLAAGGRNTSSTPQATAELYDPSTGSWTATGSMNMARFNHTATLLSNGQILAAGGISSGSSQATAELYDPSTSSWTVTASMNVARYGHTATLLSNGQVLVAGGFNSSSGNLASAELFSQNTDNDLELKVPADMTIPATSPQGAPVTFTATATDENGDSSPGPSVSCDHTSGSTFPIGTTKVTCTATDSDDSNSPVSQNFNVTVTPVLTASKTSVSTTEGRSFSAVVASGTDYGAGTLSASINWGDGQTSTGTVSLASDGSYSVTGIHTYDEEGSSFAIQVTVSASGGMSATANSPASVSDAQLSANTPTAAIKKLAVTLSTVFFDADPNGTASDYTATINWGDGSTTPGTISANSASFTATGSHTYAKHKTYTVTVTIKDAGGSSVSKALSIKV